MGTEHFGCSINTWLTTTWIIFLIVSLKIRFGLLFHRTILKILSFQHIGLKKMIFLKLDGLGLKSEKSLAPFTTKKMKEIGLSKKNIKWCILQMTKVACCHLLTHLRIKEEIIEFYMLMTDCHLNRHLAEVKVYKIK